MRKKETNKIKKPGKAIITGKDSSSKEKEKKKRAEELYKTTEEISLIKEAEQRFHKINRLYHFTSQINKMLVRVKDEHTLFKDTCNIAVDTGKYRMAWIVKTEADTKKVISLMHSGEERGYHSVIKAMSADDSIVGKILRGAASHKMKYDISNNIRNNPQAKSWKTEALNYGCRSFILLVLNKNKKAECALFLFSSEPGFFDKEEIALLVELAGDISFALENFEKEKRRKEAEAKILKTLKEISDYKYAMDQSSIITITDENGIIKYANKKFCEISKYNQKELIGQNHRIVNSGFHPKELFKDLWETVKEGKVWRNEVKSKAKDGTYFWADTIIVPFLDENRKPFQFTAIRTDITKRKKAEAAFVKSEKRYRQIVETTQEGIWVIDKNNKTVFVNRRFSEIFGYSYEEMMSKTNFDLLDEGEKSLMKEKMEQRQKGLRENFEQEYIAKSGEKIWANVSANPLFDADGNYTGALAMLTDNTDRKKAEDAIRESEEIFRRLFNESADPVLLLDDRGFFDCNYAAVSILGYSFKKQVLNKKPWDISPPKQPDGRFSKEKAEAMIAKASQKGYNRFEWVHTKSDGTEFSVEVMLTAITLKGKQLFYTIWRDITERKKAEEEIKEKEYFLRESQRVANIGSYKVNFVKGYWQSSEKLDSIFSINKDYNRSISGWLAIVHPDDKQKMDEYLRLEVLSKRKKFDKEYRIISVNDKKTKWVHGLGELKIDDNDTVVEMIGTIEDITKRKKTEEKIRETLKRYELANKATHDVIWEWDLQTNEITRSLVFTTLYGYKRDEIKNSHDWMIQKIHPLDKERVKKTIKNCIENGFKDWEAEYRFLAADGSYRNVYDRAFVLFDKNHNPTRIVGAMTDLTENRKLENELLEQRIREQKLIIETTTQAQEKERNELGRELHDNINQLLATVKMYLGMKIAGQEVQEDLVGKSYEYINEAIEEIRKLSHSLVAPSLGNISLKTALEELINDAGLLKGLQIRLLIDKRYDEKGTDKNIELMLYRIVQEQLNNIIKYAKANKVVITIKKDNDKIVFSVVDDGIGFDTTKKSRGIGFKNISNRVEFYSGKMNIISFPGKGCTLEIHIPVKSK